MAEEENKMAKVKVQAKWTYVYTILNEQSTFH